MEIHLLFWGFVLFFSSVRAPYPLAHVCSGVVGHVVPFSQLPKLKKKELWKRFHSFSPT